MPGLPYWMTPPGMMFMVAVAVSTSTYLAITSHQRPVAEAYELGDRDGYARGREDAIREAAERASVTPIRRVRGGLSEFNRAVSHPHPRTISIDA